MLNPHTLLVFIFQIPYVFSSSIVPLDDGTGYYALSNAFRGTISTRIKKEFHRIEGEITSCFFRFDQLKSYK